MGCVASSPAHEGMESAGKARTVTNTGAPTTATPTAPSPAAGDPSRVWLPDLVHRIATFLPPNEVTCTLRLVNKATSELFNGPLYTVVRSREPVPHHYFVRCWADPGDAAPGVDDGGRGATARRDGGGGGTSAGGGDGASTPAASVGCCSGDVRRLTWLQRMWLQVDTAASGSIANMEVLLAQRERFPPHFGVFTHAADAGQLAMCVWLRRRGDVPWTYSVPAVAARRGDSAMLEWAIGRESGWGVGTMAAAAAGGHDEMFLRLLERFRKRGKRPKIIYDFIEVVAEGCNLATLQHTFANLPPAGEIMWSNLTAHAAASPTPDWREKVVWLEERGERPSSYAAELVAESVVLNAEARRGGRGGRRSPAEEADATGRRGAENGGAHGAEVGFGASEAPAAAALDSSCVDRLSWLQQRGYPMTLAAARAAARVGNLPALRYLLGPSGGVRLDEQVDKELVDLCCATARGGKLEALQLLQEYGAPVNRRRVLGMAVLSGDMPLVAWLVEQITARGLAGAEAGPPAAGAGPPAAGGAGPAAPGLGILTAAQYVSFAANNGSAAGAGGGGAAATASRRHPPMCPELAAVFADSGVLVPELARELAVLAVMSCGTRGAPHRLHASPFAASSSRPWTDPGVVRLELLKWLYERGLAKLHAGVFKLAAQYGDVRLMSWLYERGCRWDARTFAAAAYAGGEAQLEWLARRGCPMGDDGEPYIRAASITDMAALRCLRRLGCPWGDTGETFTKAALNTGPDHSPVRLAALRALLAVGCPVDWEVLRAAVRRKEGVSKQRRRILQELVAQERRRWLREGDWWPLQRRGRAQARSGVQESAAVPASVAAAEGGGSGEDGGP